MRKVIFLFFAVVFAASLCSAQDTTEPASRPDQSEELEETVSGKIYTVVTGDTDPNSRPEIVVVDKDGKKVRLSIRPDTSITGEFGNALTLNEIEKGRKVTVEYATRTVVVRKARSIKLED